MTLLPHSHHDGFSVTDLVLASGSVVLAIASTVLTTNCPVCGQPSSQIHSRYRRTLADLAVGGRQLVLIITARKFVCRNPDCPRHIFCERLPGLASLQARCTARLADLHRLLGLAVGGEPGSRLAEELAVPTSGDTILRRVQQMPDEPEPTYRFVGIDDFALRKGHTYGTILIDLERGRVIDLFDGRDGAAVETWLKAHPGVEVITRDRWASYANAATNGAPQAIQVADRFHLVKNLRESIEKLFEAHAAGLDAALRPPSPEPPRRPKRTSRRPPPFPARRHRGRIGGRSGSPRYSGCGLAGSGSVASPASCGCR